MSSPTWIEDVHSPPIAQRETGVVSRVDLHGGHPTLASERRTYGRMCAYTYMRNIRP